MIKTVNFYQEIFNFIGSPIGMFLLLIIVVIAVIAIYIWKKAHEQEFELVDFREEGYEDIEKKLDLFGTKVNGFLTRGFDPIGHVMKYHHEKGEHKPFKVDKKTQKIYVDDSVSAIPYDFYIFQIGNKIRILRWIGIGTKYVIVDTKFIVNLNPFERLKYVWNINKDIQFINWGNIYVCSTAGEEYVTDIAMKRSNENTVTYLMNYAKKIIYLEMQHAKKVDMYGAKQSIKSKHIREYKKAEGEDSEAEEEDD